MSLHLRGNPKKDIRQDIHLPSLVTNDRYRDESDYCQICRLRGKKRLAEYYCTSCEMPLCPGCQETHSKTRVTAEHQVVAKKEQDVSQATCPVHRFAKVQYFCDTCQQLVCVNCTMIEHRKHEIVEIQEKVERCHHQLSAVVDELDNKITIFESELRKIEKTEMSIETNRESVKSDINGKVVTLIQMIKKQQDDLLKQIDRYLDDKSSKISRQKEALQKSYNSFVNARMAADVKNRSDLDDETFIQNVISVQRHLDSLQEPKHLDEHHFKFMHFTLTNDGRFGFMDENDMTVAPQDAPVAKPIATKSKQPRKMSKTFNTLANRNEKNLGRASKKIDEYEPDPPNSGRTESEHSVDIKLARSEPALSRNSGTIFPPKPTTGGNMQKAKLPVRSSSPIFYQRSRVEDDDNTPNLRIVNRFKTQNYIQNPSGIGVLPNGKYVIADASNYGVLVCDKSGRWQQRMLTDEVAFPTGVAVNREGNIAVTTHKYVKIFRIDGIKIKQFQIATSSCGSLAIDDYGHYVILDLTNKQLIVYDEEGLQLRTITPADIQGIRPDSYNLGVGGDHIALSYQIPDTCALVKLYNYRGDLLKSCDLPDGCRGIQMDRFGNMIAAAGDLFYVPAKGNDIMPLRAIDKKGKWFRLTTRCVGFTPQGLICTLHVNKMNQRSEVMVLHLGG